MRIRERIRRVIEILNYKFFCPKLKVLNTSETLNLILKKKVKVIRFGDGEFDYINGKAMTYQKYDAKLAYQLKDILFKNNNDDILVCIPDFFSNIDRYTIESQAFWMNNIWKRRKLYKELSKTNKIFGSAQISRPYLNIKNKGWSKEYFRKLKKLWDKKDILIVEGTTSRSGVGNDLFNNCKSVKRIICPSKNAFSKREEIEDCILNHKNKDDLILIMLGPTAKILVKDLENVSNQIIDIGHIDSEYEWFLRKATSREMIPHKHTAEFNSDSDVELVYNAEYNNQIIAEIK